MFVLDRSLPWAEEGPAVLRVLRSDVLPCSEGVLDPGTDTLYASGRAYPAPTSLRRTGELGRGRWIALGGKLSSRRAR